MADNKFPSHCLVPKNETGVTNFLKKYPEYNGQGINIAILDSGVDSNAAGLLKTPNGNVKVIERHDCSGSGDVDTSTIVKPENGIIKGLSGRQLKISKRMLTNNTDGKYNIGLKSISDLFPKSVRDKLIGTQKLKTFNEIHKTSIAEITQKINDYDVAHKNQQNISFTDKMIKENLDNTLDYLTNFDKKYIDIKTTYDCIIYRLNALDWEICIDTTEIGDLENAIYLREYSKTYDIQMIDELLTFTCNVHDDGNILEIVGVLSSHGTHVASISSGNSDCCELDGVAPGANIISLCIGDVRLNTMETGTGIIRAVTTMMNMCKRGLRIHVINMSYGEVGNWSTSGRTGEIMNELISKYGVIWVAAAGNQGPALTTTGTPPDVYMADIIGVGAYVSPDMMEAEYALRERLPANCYTWSSRDPCTDGGQGITICAPGAAIASVPNFTLTKQQLMNGTSMAAPHVTGAIALLLSGLIANGIPYSPFSVKRALWNTATKIDYIDEFAQGNGLLNVEKAYEHLTKYSDVIERDMRFFINVGINKAKGIYLRNTVNNTPTDFSVDITPKFFDEDNADSNLLINFNLQMTLLPSEAWIECGKYLDMCYAKRSISVRINPAGLPVGVHKASIKAYDSKNIAKGTLFEIPITVIQPITLQEDKPSTLNFDKVIFKPATIQRHFIMVPTNATCAIIRLIAIQPVRIPDGRFLLHTMQILPDHSCHYNESNQMVSIGSDAETMHTIRVIEKYTLEICIAKFWSSLGEATLMYSVEFRGINTVSPITMHSALGVHRIDLKPLHCEDLSPSIQLKNAVQVLKPVDSKISPLPSARDVIPFGRNIYQNMLTYNLHITKAQEVSIYAPLFTYNLYESLFESQLWMLFDVNKMLVLVGDAYVSKTYHKLEKGEYTIRLQIRHENRELLEKISEATMLIKYKITNPLSVDCYRTSNLAIESTKKLQNIKTNTLMGKLPIPIYVPPIPQERITKAAIPNQCSWLEGGLCKYTNELLKNFDVTPFKYILMDVTTPSKKIVKDSKTKTEDLNELMRDFQNNMLVKLDLEKAEILYEDIIKEYPKYVTAHLSLAQKLDPLTEIKNQLPFSFEHSLKDNTDLSTTKDKLKRILHLSELVVKDIDEMKLLAYYGLKSDSRLDAIKIKTTMDKQKSNLLEAYVRIFIATAKLNIIEGFETAKSASADSEVDQSKYLSTCDEKMFNIIKFVDPLETRVILASLWHAYVHKQYGRMLNCLQKLYDDKLQRDVLEEIVLVSDTLEWPHISRMIKKYMVTSNPTSYRL